MENKNIIIILLVIIVVLAAAIGFILLNPTHAKEPTKIKITSDKEQYKGGKLKIQLSDLNKTPLSKEVVNIKITNKNGKVVVDDVRDNDKLIDNTVSNTTQKLTIKEKVAQKQETSNTNYEQKLEFNGKTHEQNVQDAKESRSRGGQWSGATDEQIEELISKEERDGGRI